MFSGGMEMFYWENMDEFSAINVSFEQFLTT